MTEHRIAAVGKEASHVRATIIGSGFSGLGIAIALQRAGIEFRILERSGEVGGTWRDNRYPGCQCDVPSHLYSFSFAPNPEWSRTYSCQPEIWDYLRQTAKRFGIVPHIRFGEELREAVWDDATQRWIVETTTGTLTTDVLISGHGALSEPSMPELPGLERFEGTVFHSAVWDHDHDLTGERVAVIGTGASAIQFVPQIQPRVRQLVLFQRTPPWVLPHTDRPITRLERTLYRRVPALQRLVRLFIYLMREVLVVGLTRNPRFVRPIERLATFHLRRQVKDPALRAKLLPAYSPGCKRLLLSDDYYPTLTKDNVEVVTERIARVGPRSIVTTDGREHEVDTIIVGTGFKVSDHPIAGRVLCGGLSLARAWEESGAQAYLGTTVPGFPNLFLMTGPNTGIGHTSLVVMIESQIPYIVDCLRLMEAEDVGCVEVRREPFETFNREVQRRMRRTVWSVGGCASWYMDAHGRNSTLWPDFTWKYRRRTRRFDPENYTLTARASRLMVVRASAAGAR